MHHFLLVTRCPFIQPFIHLSLLSSFCQSTHSSIHSPFTLPFTCSPVHPPMHLLTSPPTLPSLHLPSNLCSKCPWSTLSSAGDTQQRVPSGRTRTETEVERKAQGPGRGEEGGSGGRRRERVLRTWSLSSLEKAELPHPPSQHSAHFTRFQLARWGTVWTSQSGSRASRMWPLPSLTSMGPGHCQVWRDSGIWG